MNELKYTCSLCEFIYDESRGEPSQGINPGTLLEELSGKFEHPDCDCGTEMFRPIEEIDIHATELPVAHKILISNLSALRWKNPEFDSVFETLGIDTIKLAGCSLKEACVRNNLNPYQVVKKLLDSQLGIDDALEGAEDLNDIATSTIKQHHEEMDEKLSQTALKIEIFVRQHAARYPHLLDCRAEFFSLKQELDSHIEKEKSILFELCFNGENKQLPLEAVKDPIELMRKEHCRIHMFTRNLRASCDNFRTPEDACEQYKELMLVLEKLETRIHQQIHIENNILFPRITGRHYASKLSPA